MFEVVPQQALNEANVLIRVKDSQALDYETVTSFTFTVGHKHVTWCGLTWMIVIGFIINGGNTPYKFELIKNSKVYICMLAIV